jgi:enoyl-CoA hydratase
VADRVEYELEDGVATVVMDDGKVNALSPGMLSELNAALDRAKSDRAAVVLTGRDGIFSAGFDLKVLRAGGPDAVGMLRSGFELAERLMSFESPVVIACSGHALAMGVFLVLSADFRIGALGDFRIGANEVAIGLVMPEFGVEMCRHMLSVPYFHRAVVNAEIFSPRDAVAAGFLDDVVQPGDLRGAAREVASALGALDRATHTATKLRARSKALEAVRGAIDSDESLTFG